MVPVGTSLTDGGGLEAEGNASGAEERELGYEVCRFLHESVEFAVEESGNGANGDEDGV